MTISARINRWLAVALIAFSFAAMASLTAQANIVLTFTDQAAWEAALPGGSVLLTEDFGGPMSSFAPDSFNPVGPVVIRNDVDGSPTLEPVGLDGNGFLEGFLLEEGGDDVELEFFRQNMVGVAFLGLRVHPNETFLSLEEIGFDFGTGSVLGFEFLACEVVGTCPSSPTEPDQVPNNHDADGVVDFLGFVFDGTLTEFVIDHGDDIRNLSAVGDTEQFLLDGIIVAVPEPGTSALFGVGLVGLASLRRQRIKS